VKTRRIGEPTSQQPQSGRPSSGGGGIRTHGSFDRRFSGPVPSTARPPLRDAPMYYSGRVAGKSGDRRRVTPKGAEPEEPRRATSRCFPGGSGPRLLAHLDYRSVFVLRMLDTGSLLPRFDVPIASAGRSRKSRSRAIGPRDRSLGPIHLSAQRTTSIRRNSLGRSHCYESHPDGDSNYRPITGSHRRRPHDDNQTAARADNQGRHRRRHRAGHSRSCVGRRVYPRSGDPDVSRRWHKQVVPGGH
jgi:hypothetical protein